MPDYHAHWTRATAPLLDELGAVLDHVTAQKAGGAASESNLVTSCNKCNAHKSDTELDAWDQREKRKPIKGKYGEPGAWDGMSGLFVLLAERHKSDVTVGECQWLDAIKNHRA